MGNQLTLEVLIKSVLDAAGVKAGEAEIKQLTSTIEKATDASKGLDLSADKIVKGLEAQRAAALQTGKAWENLTQAERDAQRETAQRAVRLLEADEASKKAAGSSQNLARDLGTLKQAGAGVQQIFSGLAQGNMLAVAQGFASIGKAAEQATGAMRSFFAQLARGGAVGAAIAAPLAVAAAAVKQYADDIEKANKRIQDNAVKSAQARAKATEEAGARIQKVLDQELATLGKIEEAYQRSQKRTEEAYSNEAKRRDAQRGLRDTTLDIEEKRALEGATSESEKEKIRRNFARRRQTSTARDDLADMRSSDYEQDIVTNKAQDVISEARARLDEAQSKVRDARQEYEAQKALADELKDDTTGAGEQARKSALAARDRLKLVEGAADKVADETSKIIAGANAQIETAKLTKELTEIARQQLRATLGEAAREKTTPAATPEDRKDAAAVKAVLAADAGPQKATAGSGGTITKGGEAIMVTSADSVEKLKDAGREVAGALKAVGEFATTVTDKSKDLKRDLAQQRERTGGG
jgi:hypothetical protein